MINSIGMLVWLWGGPLKSADLGVTRRSVQNCTLSGHETVSNLAWPRARLATLLAPLNHRLMNGFFFVHGFAIGNGLRGLIGKADTTSLDAHFSRRMKNRGATNRHAATQQKGNCSHSAKANSAATGRRVARP
jgi:hypothetical protein